MTDVGSDGPSGNERRHGERRSGWDRRGTSRGRPDRRGGDRRGQAAACVAGAMLLAVSASPAAADVYTRRNARGVLEATNRPTPDGGYKLTYRSKGSVIHSAGFRPADVKRGQYEPFIQEASTRHGVSADLVRAVIQTESAYDQRAISSMGARGLMQLMPDTARRFGVRDPFDARDNILGGVRYLRVLIDLFRGDVVLAVAAYNAGEGAVARHGGVPPYRETRGYVRKILALLARTAARVAQPPASTMAASAATPPDPSAARAAAPGADTPPEPRVEKKPRTWYRWKDASGILHVAETPPPSGIQYTIIRSSD